MTTVASLRSTYLDGYLHRAAASTVPWTDAELQQLLTDALTKLWPRYGVWTYGDVASNQTSNLYTVPAAFGSKYRISRIDLLDSTGRYLDRVSNWRKHSATQVIVKPIIATGYTLRFYGYVPFSVTGSDLPTELEPTIAHRAAGAAYANLAAELMNSERQQNLDSGKVISYGDAIGLAAYHERVGLDGLIDHPSLVVFGPRGAHRG